MKAKHGPSFIGKGGGSVLDKNITFSGSQDGWDKSKISACLGTNYYQMVPNPSKILATYGNTERHGICGYVQQPPVMAQSPSCCADNIIHVVLEGEGCLTRYFEGNKQQIFLASKQIHTSAAYCVFNWVGNNIHARILDIHIPELLLKTTWQENFSDQREAIHLNSIFGLNDPLLSTMVHTLLGYWRSSHPCKKLLIETATEQLIVYLLGLYGGKLSIYRGGLAPLVLKRLKDYIEEHLAEPLTLEELASQVSLSKYHFVRTFKQSTGTTPHSYVLERRLNHASQLLKNGDQLISNIAYDCGFSDPAHFSRVFRRKFGLGPRDFRSKKIIAT